MTEELRKKTITSICVSLFLSLTLFLFGPAYMYFTNIQEYLSSFSAISPFLFALCFFCFLLLTTILVFLRHSIHQKAVALFLALAFLLWLQGNILVWHYGPLDGREIDWNASIFKGLIDSTLWIVFLAGAYLSAARILKIARQVSIAFIIVQTISLSIVIVQSPEVSRPDNKLIQDERSIYEFSSGRNVVVLILDSFQADVFQDIINEDPYYRDMFDGFIFYRNAVGGYPYTFAAVPLILTGRYYDNSLPVHDFVRNVFSSNSVPRILKDNGYQVDLIGGKLIYADESIASNRVQITELLDQNIPRKEAASVIDLSLLKYVPHFAKKYVYNNQTWLLSRLDWDKDASGFPPGFHRDSIELIKKMVQRANAGNASNTFKYIHLTLPHGPIMVNEQLEYEEMRSTRDNYKKQAKASLKLVDLLLEALKRIETYDSTLFLILADHGYGSKITKGAFKDSSIKNDEWAMIERIKSKAIPLFLVKPIDSRGGLKISDAPVAHSDVAKTIISELGMEAKVPGVSVFTISETDLRSRRYLDHEWGRDAWRDLYMPPMREYIVSGFSWLNRSWQPTHKLYTKEGIRDFTPRDYRYGMNITFGEIGNSHEYKGWGWSNPERGFTWTDKNSASLIIPMSMPKSDVEMKVTCKPFVVPGQVERQRVKVVVNNQEIGEWMFEDSKLQEQTILIPRSYLRDNFAKIILELPDAVSPADLRVSGDSRLLGIRMHSIVFRETDRIYESLPYQWGSLIEFGADGNYRNYQGKGWGESGKDFTWMNGPEASLTLPLHNGASTVELTATLDPVTITGMVEKCRVKIFFGRQIGGEWFVVEDGVQEHAVLIAGEDIKDGHARVVFKVADIAEPSMDARSADKPAGGIRIHSIILDEIGGEPGTEYYQWGSPILFGIDGNCADYQGGGWNLPEEDFAWTYGKRAVVKLPLMETDSDIRLKATFRPFVISGKVDEQRVIIYANDRKVGNWTAKKTGIWDRVTGDGKLFQEHTIGIPKGLLSNDDLNITFELPDAVSPKELKASEDTRVLGIAMKSIVLTEMPVRVDM